MLKAEGAHERGGDGGGSARASPRSRKIRQHHADDDDLAAVRRRSAQWWLSHLNGAGLAQQVQNGERAEESSARS